MKKQSNKTNIKLVCKVIGGLMVVAIVIGVIAALAIPDNSSDETPTASTNAKVSSSSKASTKAKKQVYSDSMIDVTFEGLSNQAGIDGELFIGLTVKNKSSKSITVSLTDVCVDDTMMQTGSGVPLTILPGKKGTGAFFGKNSTKPGDVKKIGFKVYLIDESAGQHLKTTKQIVVKLK